MKIIEKNLEDFLKEKKFINKTKLCNVMTKYGSDKGSRHNYTSFYNYIFENIKDEELNFFEVGLGTNNPNIPSSMGVNGKPGASLKGWKEYFSKSNIYGADVDKKILFDEDRINTFYVNQLNSDDIYNMWNNEILKDKIIDVIIDDGLHTFEANRIFFENSISNLKDGGIYIIEDVSSVYVKDFESWIKNINCKFSKILTIPINSNVQENNRLVVIKK